MDLNGFLILDMEKRILAISAALGGLAVILGAMAAHQLKAYLDETSLDSFNTAVRYQIYHVLFLMLVNMLRGKIGQKSVNLISLLAITGILLFSGSIYLLSTSAIHGLNVNFLGPVTPLGGIFLISAWFMLTYRVLKPVID